jgi:hypothetical protein
MLHARTLGFVHPSTGQYLEFSTACPPDMEAIQGVIEHEMVDSQ